MPGQRILLKLGKSTDLISISWRSLSKFSRTCVSSASRRTSPKAPLVALASHLSEEDQASKQRPFNGVAYAAGPAGSLHS